MIDSIITECIKAIAKSASERVFKRKDKGLNISNNDLNDLFLSYIKSVYRWSEFYQFVGMEAPKSIDDASLDLKYHGIPRRYKGIKDIDDSVFVEKEFIRNHDFYVILGDPGSGKTTTIKRIIRMLIHEEQVCQEDIYKTPIVLQLREVKEELYVNLWDVVAEKIGFIVLKDNIVNGVGIKYHMKVTDVKHLIVDILEKSNAILLLDGLDEMPESIKDKVYRDIEEISRYLDNSKIIATCRSGDFHRNLEGFRIIEIMPLSEEQIVFISNKLLKNNADGFIRNLKKLPYYDMADRPLLLKTLIYLYNRSRDLPEQPSIVYKRMIRLLLDDWDQQRGIKRISKYSKFDAERKLEFLSTLSFHLLYKAKEKIFSSYLLEESYQEICEAFNLPENESLQVVQEIETHNGIIVSSSEGYEFSHLSIQEYLAANHIVRSPQSKILTKYMQEYPDPLAIAVSISSEPSKWFASLILNDEIFNCINQSNIIQFLERLVFENPYFVPDSEFGYAIIELFDKYWGEKGDPNNEVIEILLGLKNVKESITDALRECKIIEGESNRYYYVLQPLWHRLQYKYFTPSKKLRIPRKVFVGIIKENSRRFIL